jgi:hypothetical protein
VNFGGVKRFFFFSRFGNSQGISFLQAFTGVWKFTKFSPGVHIFFQAWAINQEVSESHQVFTAVMVGM